MRLLQRHLPHLILVVVGTFIVAPLVMVTFASFTTGGIPWLWKGFTLDSYAAVISDRKFQTGTVFALAISAMATVISLTLGVMAAYALDRARFPGRGLIEVAFLSPLSIPRVVVGVALFIVYLSLIRSLYDSMLGVALAHCFLLLPFVITFIKVGMSWIDPRLEEAGRDLGDTATSAAFKLTFPLLVPAMTAVAGLVFVMSFDEVDTTIFLIRTKVHTLSTEVFLYAQNHQDGTVAAVSVLVLAATIVFTIVVVMISSYALSRGAGIQTIKSKIKT